MANVTGVSKKQNGLKKRLQVDASCLSFMFIESNVEKHRCTMPVFLYRQNNLDPRNISKAKAQVHVHTPAVAQDTMHKMFVEDLFSLHFNFI